MGQILLLMGQMNFFHTPYSWNGSDNLIVEFYFENENPNANSTVFNTENITADNALCYEQKKRTPLSLMETTMYS